MSIVTDVAAAPSAIALAHVNAVEQFETDYWDVHHARPTGADDVVLLPAAAR
jgi:hypothetical protein